MSNYTPFFSARYVKTNKNDAADAEAICEAGIGHRRVTLPRRPTEGELHFGPRVTAADFRVNPMTAIENKRGRRFMVDCDYSPVQSRCRKADIETAKH